MTDRELLKFAAKAAEMPRSMWWWVDGVLCKAGDVRTPWNPLTDDGDCARLESKLRISVVWIENLQEVHAFIVPSGVVVTEKYDDHCGDKGKARRYASTRAAAAIGKAMPSTDGGGV